MPLPEPPAEEVAEVLRLLDYARQNLAAAAQRHRIAEHLAGIGPAPQMLARVMVAARLHEARLWTAEVEELEQRARALGLNP
jgi:hypothetical protein